ncbi:unnamed protein product, partial [Choristocarpus tenellus]
MVVRRNEMEGITHPPEQSVFHGDGSTTIAALGHRTVVLHVEIKRLRAWWKRIIASGCLDASLLTPTTQEGDQHKSSDPLSVLADARELLAVWDQQELGGVVCVLADRVGKSAGSSPEAMELAALICGLGTGWRVDMVWQPHEHTAHFIDDHRALLFHAVHGDGKALSKLGLSASWLKDGGGLGAGNFAAHGLWRNGNNEKPLK